MSKALENLTGTELKVCELIAERQAFGRAKYGTTVAENPLTKRQWLQHALEEALDLSVYLKRLCDEMDSEYSARDDWK